MLARKTILDQIEIKRDGMVQVRLLKCIVDDAKPDEIIASQYHRSGFEPGTGVEDQIKSIDDHLTFMGEAKTEAADWARVRNVIQIEHTPEVIAQFRQKLLDQTAVVEQTKVRR